MSDHSEDKQHPKPRCMMRNAAADMLSAGNPKETREAFDKLVDAGASGEEAVQMIGSVVAREVGEMMREGKPHNPERLRELLKDLE